MGPSNLVLTLAVIVLLSTTCHAAARNEFSRYFAVEEIEQSILEKSDIVQEQAAQNAKNGPAAEGQISKEGRPAGGVETRANDRPAGGVETHANDRPAGGVETHANDRPAGEVETESTGQEKVATTPEDAKYKLSYENYELTWRNFKREHNRSYESATEEKKRFTIFMDNVKLIERHNWQFRNGLTTYWMDINQFSDWTSEEFAAMLPVMDSSIVDKWGVPYNGTHEPLYNVDAPTSMDWRSKGYVTGVKNQGSCGSCWSFSATGSLEGQWFAKTRRLVPLSEQQLVDCSSSYGNKGCHGGLMDRAFRYIRDAGGLQSEQTYPYRASQYSCRFNRQNVVATVKSYRDIASGDENALKTAVASVGPVSVAIKVTPNFQYYRGGLFVDQTCNTGQINHGVLVVGYGNTGYSDYWIVKNSWGPTWGDQGYVYMARNRGNMCFIASLASYPIV